MAVIQGQHVSRALGAVENPMLTVEHDGFVWLQMPIESEAQRSPGGSTLIWQFPVSANARVIAGQMARSFFDDVYNRIHISPTQLALGNLVSTQSSPAYVWNAYLEPRTLVAITGLQEGIALSGQPAPALNFSALQERIWAVFVTPVGPAVLDAAVSWAFENGAVATLRITGNRVVAFSFAPDWRDGIVERLTWSTDVLQSPSAAEQRRALRLAPRREFEAPVLLDGRERQLFDLAMFGWGAQVWALPIWHDVQMIEGAAQGTQLIACVTTHRDFRTGGLAMLRSESAFTYEVVEVEGVAAGSLSLKRPTQQPWPAGSRLYPVRTAQLMKAPQMTRLTDQAQRAEVHFLLSEPPECLPALPTTLYRGAPVLELRPNEVEDVSGTWQRLLLELDSGMALPLLTDTANRAFPLQSHAWQNLGRAEQATYRSLLYALRGRQKALWLPTHANDLTLVDAVTPSATTFDIAAIGYTRFASARPGRRDIRLEFWDGSVLHRRITGSAEIGGEVERLVLDAAFGRPVAPADLHRISWMMLARLDQDAIEIQHETDAEGVSKSHVVFRGVRDDEL
ncbi:MAG TPA: hypothetical protein VJA19_03815 [Pseudomonas sp.]|nr:hypothetical protein [Pseudomonas sp.]